MFLWLPPALNFWDIFFPNDLIWSRFGLFFSLLAEAFKSDCDPCYEPNIALLLLELTPPASSSSEVTSSSSSTSITTLIFSSSSFYYNFFPSSSSSSSRWPPALSLSSLSLSSFNFSTSCLANFTQVLTEILWFMSAKNGFTPFAFLMIPSMVAPSSRSFLRLFCYSRVIR